MPRRGTTLVLRGPGALLGVAGAAIRWRPGARAGDPLLRSADALILSTVAASGFGIAYWIVAARAYPEHVLGEQSAAISTMLMLSNFAQMNMFFTLGRFVPTAGRATGRLIASVYATSAALSVVLGIGFVAVVPLLSENLSALFTGPAMAVAFVFGVALWSLFALQDGVLTALRRATWVPVENALFGLVKLVMLVVFAGVFVSGGIFASWTIPTLLAVVPVNLLIYRRVLRARAAPDAPSGAFSFRSIRRFVAVDYVSGLFLQSYTTALPLVIVATLGARANAEFYVAYVVIAAVDLVSVNLATSLLVEGAHDEARLAEYTRRILRCCCRPCSRSSSGRPTSRRRWATSTRTARPPCCDCSRSDRWRACSTSCTWPRCACSGASAAWSRRRRRSARSCCR
jgi:hypothetical protein